MTPEKLQNLLLIKELVDRFGNLYIQNEKLSFFWKTKKKKLKSQFYYYYLKIGDMYFFAF